MRKRDCNSFYLVTMLKGLSLETSSNFILPQAFKVSATIFDYSTIAL
jgi:hypothetical protein